MHVFRTAFMLATAGFGSCMPSAYYPALSPDQLEALEALGKDPSDFRLPGSLPFPNITAGTDMLPGIEQIVWIMYENHSWDNIYGTLNRSDANGFTYNSTGQPQPLVVQKYLNGSIQDLFEMPNNCAPTGNGPTQNWMSTHQQMDNGTMDGWVYGGEEPKPIAMGYWTADGLPFFHALGEVFPVSDTFFCSCPGQTWCNRMYLLAATSLGLVDTSQIITLTNPPAGNPPSGTIFDELTTYNISWTNYVQGFGKEFPTLALYETESFFASQEAPYGKDLSQFFVDAAAGTLPQFSFLDENGNNQSMENPQNTIIGETLLFDIVEALANSPQWNTTLLIVNFDEHGGYYDHVYPPRALAPDGIAPIVPEGEFEYDGFTRYGFRVPNVVVGPYAKKDHVSHILYDHTSVLATLQYKWNLPALTLRDANANNMLDYIDLDALASKTPNFPGGFAGLNLGGPGNTTERLSCGVFANGSTNPGVIPPVGSMINVTEGCNHDNCLRAALNSRYSSSASAFCATYTADIYVALGAIPTYLANCHYIPSAVSSACSCLVTNRVSATSTVRTTPTPLV